MTHPPAHASTSRVSTTPLTAAHWPAVRAIFADGIASGHATFETDAPSWETFDGGRLPDHRFVAVDTDATVLGWVTAAATSSRCAYTGVVEHSVYVAAAARGRGVGRLLLDTLLASTEAAGIWTVQGGVFPENTASLALHRAAGFRVVGTRERIGRMTHGPMAGHWRDVLLLEHRTP